MFDYWYDIEPEAFYDQIGPNVASNFYNDFKKDIRLMKEIGLNSVRTSIQWTRLIDDFETATLNEDNVRFYNDVIDELIKNGIKPVINLHHFDLSVASQWWWPKENTCINSIIRILWMGRRRCRWLITFNWLQPRRLLALKKSIQIQRGALGLF